MFQESFRKHGQRPALVTESGVITYLELDRAANRCANFLLGNGVGAGDVVAVMLGNSAEFVVVDQAIIRAGACKTAINAMLSIDEQCHLLRASRAKIAVAGPDQIDAALRVQSEGGVLTTVVAVGVDRAPQGSVGWTASLASRSEIAPLEEPTPDTIGRLSFTGGTTGIPKGIRHAWGRMALNLLSHVIEMELDSSDRLLLTSPLAHSAGLYMQTALLRGAAVHLGDGFNAREVIARVRREDITYLFLVPTAIYRLLDALALDGGTLPSVRTILYGAAPVSRETISRGIEMLGPVFLQFFGQTEAPNWITRLGKDEHLPSEGADRLASCGRAVTMAEVRIIDEAGSEMPPGEVGEVVTRTPYTMVDYVDNPQATEDAFVEGWLRTGDLGWMDAERFVYLVDRAKDMIITGGLNVYCREVERAIAAIGGVADVAVFGMPDPEWGEIVVAAVVPESGLTLDPNQVRQASREVLSRYKVPKVVITVTSLPLTAAGKIDKKNLRATWIAAGEVTSSALD
jgi:fatty-acyl-CoA synthase